MAKDGLNYYCQILKYAIFWDFGFPTYTTAELASKGISESPTIKADFYYEVLTT